MSSTRLRQPVLASSALTWVLTVDSARCRRSPISALGSPSHTSDSTSRSRPVSGSNRPFAPISAPVGLVASMALAGPDAFGFGPIPGPEPGAVATVSSLPSPAPRWARTVPVTAGSSQDPPRATVRTASSRTCAEASLRRNPLAPARNAASTSSSSSKVVSTSTGVRRSASRAAECSSFWSSPPVRMARIAVTPSMTGMRMSIRTTSTGAAPWSCCAREPSSSRAAAPSTAVPTTSRSGWEDRSISKAETSSA